jgi:hypothetical protein
MAYSGAYRVKNKKKYKGDVTDVIYRSLCERQIMVYCDTCDDILYWGSETVIIPYYYEADQKMHRYFLDFYVEIKCKSGTVKRMILEYKPFSQTQPPKKTKVKNHWKSKKKYINATLTYIKNQNKWKAAKQWAELKGYEFYVISEKDIKKMQFFKDYVKVN